MMVQLDDTTYVRADTVLRIEKDFNGGVIVLTNDERTHLVAPSYAGQAVSDLAYQLAASINRALKS